MVAELKSSKRIALIDLSAIYRQYWHSSEHLEVSTAYNRTIATVTATTGFDAVAVCCDRPPYKRREIFKEYKAHREKAPEAMHEQLRAVEEYLDARGFHVIGAAGYEADDIIATIAEWSSAAGHETVIFSADKDLMQLVGERTSVVSTQTHYKYGPVEVKQKLGVDPSLVADLLALAGDAADNIPGVKGVGVKTAAAWLNDIGPLDVILQNIDRLPERFRQPVKDNIDAITVSWRLAQLMTDAPISPEIILTTKAIKEAPSAAAPIEIEEEESTPVPVVTQASAQTQTLVPAPAVSIAPVEWERSLEPRSSKQAWDIANVLYKSRLFGDFPNPEAILAIVMTGRALGMDTVASLRGFHLIKGKACPSAALLIGLVKRSPQCEWFRLVESTDTIATWETKRRDEPEPTRLSYTIAMAERAQLTKLDQWQKRQATMLRWRGGTELARAVYPDLVAGLHSDDEMEDSGGR